LQSPGKSSTPRIAAFLEQRADLRDRAFDGSGLTIAKRGQAGHATRARPRTPPELLRDAREGAHVLDRVALELGTTQRARVLEVVRGRKLDAGSFSEPRELSSRVTPSGDCGGERLEENPAN